MGKGTGGVQQATPFMNQARALAPQSAAPRPAFGGVQQNTNPQLMQLLQSMGYGGLMSARPGLPPQGQIMPSQGPGMRQIMPSQGPMMNQAANLSGTVGGMPQQQQAKPPPPGAMEYMARMNQMRQQMPTTMPVPQNYNEMNAGGIEGPAFNQPNYGMFGYQRGAGSFDPRMFVR
jgi:hypothetical protein